MYLVFFLKEGRQEQKQEQKAIHYRGIDDLLAEKQKTDSKEERLRYLGDYRIKDISFTILKPNQKNYWLDTEETNFDTLLPLVSKDKTKKTLFRVYSNGVASGRDNWVYDLDKNTLEKKMKYFIDTYNQDVEKLKGSETEINNLINRDIKHTAETENHIKKGRTLDYNEHLLVSSLYRPFSKKNTYFSDIITMRKYQIPKIFGKQINRENVCIAFNCGQQFDTLVTDSLYDHHFVGDPQGIPLHIYNSTNEEENLLSNTPQNHNDRQSNITEWGVEQFQTKYKDKNITREEIFYYVYAVFHHEGYLTKYKTDLKRELPRIPFYKEFKKISLLGKELSEYHIDFEKCKKHIAVKINEQQKWSNEIKPLLKVVKDNDKNPTGEIILDSITTIEGIPKEAFDYQIGNRSPIEWLLSQHKIKNPSQADLNNYGKVFELFNTQKQQLSRYREISRGYLMDLIPRLVTVSLETLRIEEEIKGCGEVVE